MRFLYAAIFVAGLMVGVRAIFFGVDRRRGKEVRRPPPGLNLPVIAAALIAFGAVGYIVLFKGQSSQITAVLAAALSAGAAWVASGWGLAKWAWRAPLVDEHDAAETIQGHPAVVVEAIDGKPGRVCYQLHGESHTVAAVSVDGAPIARDTDVVIEHIDDGIAHVETWATVERRL